jgi:hypothetical protein
MDVSEKTNKKVEEKEVEFFLDRLVDILLMQIEQKEVKICKQGSLSESPEIIKPTEKLLVAR